MSGEASSKAGGIRQPPSQRVSSLLKSTVASIAHTVADPVQDVLTAPATRRTVAGAAALSTVVLLSIGTAVVAYITFYCLYIPKIGFSKEVLLQYGYVAVNHADLESGRDLEKRTQCLCFEEKM